MADDALQPRLAAAGNKCDAFTLDVLRAAVTTVRRDERLQEVLDVREGGRAKASVSAVTGDELHTLLDYGPTARHGQLTNLFELRHQ